MQLSLPRDQTMPDAGRYQPVIITLTMICMALYMLTSHVMPNKPTAVKVHNATKATAAPTVAPHNVNPKVTRIPTAPVITKISEPPTAVPTTAPKLTIAPTKAPLADNATPGGVDYNQLLNNLKHARELLEESLRQDYGADNFARIFAHVGDFLGGKESPARLVQRLQRKILRAKLSESTVPFVWAQGGHSSAAGHGNFIPESQTAVLERQVRPLFAALNINFIGRNYAMGDTSSGFEIAACSKEIFGTDVDVLVWDFGMTDGNDFEKMELYFVRASFAKGQPALVAMHIFGQWEKYRIPLLEQLNDMGLTVLYMNRTVDSDMEDAIPDTFGQTQAEINQMPPLVQYYKCEGKVEKGEPGCDAHKYNESFCPQRPFKAPWHPGWKYHARTGNAMALYLASVLEDALVGLRQSTLTPEEQLAQLDQEHNQNYEKFRNTPVSQSLENLLWKATGEDGVDPQVIVKGPNLCRTGRLPAESRYKGLTTGDGDARLRPPTYVEALEQANPDTAMRLVRGISKRQAECDSFLFQHDYKHYFLTSYMDQDTKHLSLPNSREREAFDLPAKWVGYVAVCLSKCAWDQCPEGDLRLPYVFNGTNAAQIQVNGIDVTGFSTIIKDCDFLQNDGGFVWPLTDGVVDISVRILQEGAFMRIQSALVW